MRYLEQQTDEAHPAVITDILDYLADEGISTSSKTVTKDIDLLIEAGFDVVCNKSRQNQYFIGERHFETPELKLLIDAAQASKFLTAKRSHTLIDKFDLPRKLPPEPRLNPGHILRSPHKTQKRKCLHNRRFIAASHSRKEASAVYVLRIRPGQEKRIQTRTPCLRVQPLGLHLEQ